MRILSWLYLTLLFHILLMKKSDSEGFIKFTAVDTEEKDCSTPLERYTFKIIAQSIYIEEGTTITLDLAKPDYAQASCKIYEDDIKCSIDISKYPLDFADIELPEDIFGMVPYEYEGWEEMLKTVSLYEHCMPSSYIGTFTPNDTYSCRGGNYRELIVKGVFETNLHSKINEKYELQALYIEDEFHRYYSNQYANLTLKINDKIDNIQWNAEIIYKLEAKYEARFFPTIASNIDNEDFYIKSSNNYNLNETCKNSSPYGVRLNIKKSLFMLIFFLL